MDKIWDRKSFEVGGHWPVWRGWKKRMNTQNRQKLNAKKKEEKKEYVDVTCIALLMYFEYAKLLQSTFILQFWRRSITFYGPHVCIYSDNPHNTFHFALTWLPVLAWHSLRTLRGECQSSICFACIYGNNLLLCSIALLFHTSP